MSSNTLLNFVVVSSDSSTTRENITTSDHKGPRVVRKMDRNKETAIYAYLQAVRALGHETVNTVQIADALSLPISEVNRSLAALRKKGVRTLDVR